MLRAGKYLCALTTTTRKTTTTLPKTILVSTHTHTQAFVPPTTTTAFKQGTTGLKASARTRGEAQMAAGETALIIQNKGK
jgi:hypothetical protein